jgi:hypothetical protein
MLVYRPVHELPGPPERFWALYLDSGFQRELFVDGLGWEAPTITRLDEGELEIVRHLRAVPRVELPAALATIIKQAVGFTEEGRFDRAAQTFHLRHRTNVFGERLRLEGRFRVESRPGGRCARCGELEVEAKIPAIGGLVERAVELNMKKGWDQSARWLARRLAG